jgi:hypothetical protein
MGSDIFLSYSRADRALAEKFVETASRRGVNVWFDEKIEGGEDWRATIVDALGSSKALVILFSDHSNASTQLIKELAIADNLKKRVIPVLIADAEPRGAYLYEMAARNWINIHPNPETRLPSLIETLVTQLELGAGTPPLTEATAKPAARSFASAPVSLFAPEVAAPAVDASPARPPASIATAPRQASPPLAAPIRLAAAGVGAPAQNGSWFPLGRYDLVVLAPILVISFLIGGLNTDPHASSMGLGISAIAFSIYMFFIASRNARLNQGIFSARSFLGYFAVGVIGLSPALVDADIQDDKVTSLLGLVGLSLIVAVCANLFQVIYRNIFMRNTFRSRIEQPLPS